MEQTDMLKISCIVYYMVMYSQKTSAGLKKEESIQQI